METVWIAGALKQPLAVGFLVGAVLLSAAVLYLREDSQISIRPWRLATGYAGAILVTLAMAAAWSYVSAEDALVKWQVSAENYWPTVLNVFFTLGVLLVYFVVLGIAVVGTPVLFLMAKWGRDTIPGLLLASVAISLVFSVLIDLVGSSTHLWFYAQLLGMHLMLALGFGLGAGLPWKRSRGVTSA